MKKICLLLALVLPGILFAQDGKSKEVEQIVITKKGTGNEKMNIVVDGDKVTVNGETLDKSDDANITVTRRKIKDIESLNDGIAPGLNRDVVIRRQLAMAPPRSPNKAMLGVSTQKTEQGVEVVNVSPESAAEKAGLKQGDIIKEVDRVKIETPDDLSKAIKDKNPLDKVTVVYLRDKKQYTAVAELSKWKAPDMTVFTPRFDNNFNMQQVPGFNIEEFRGQLGDLQNQQGNMMFRFDGMPAGPRLGIKIQDLENGPGVKIMEVLKGSDADKAGLKEGDIIREVEGNTVENTDDVMSLVRKSRAGKAAIGLKIDRNGKSQHVAVKLTKKIKSAEI